MELKRDGRTLYVPAPESILRHTIRAGSGIVGTVQDDGRILIDYEGNLYGAENMKTYEERALHAFDRHVWKGRGYPTAARAFATRDDLIEVGFILIPEEPDAEAVRATLIRRHGFTSPAAVRAVCRDLAKPQIHVDRQDVVDQWCEEATP